MAFLWIIEFLRSRKLNFVKLPIYFRLCTIFLLSKKKFFYILKTQHKKTKERISSMSNQTFLHPVIYETSSHTFEIKEASWLVKILQVLHLGRLFRYYSPEDMNIFLKKIENLSKNISDHNMTKTDVSYYKGLYSLKKVFLKLPSCAGALTISNKCQTLLDAKKEAFTKPSSIILLEHFKHNPQEASSSFLFLMRHCAQENLKKEEFSYFAQQLLNLVPDKENAYKPPLYIIVQILADFLKSKKYSNDIKFHVINNLLANPVTNIDNLLSFFNIAYSLSLKPGLTTNADIKSVLYSLPQKLLESISSYPSFETALDWFCPLINSDRAPNHVKATLLCGMLKFFQPPTTQSLKERFAEKYCGDFFESLFSSRKLTQDTKEGILSKLKTLFQNKPSFFLESVAKWPIEEKFLNSFLSDSQTEIDKLLTFASAMELSSLPKENIRTFALAMLEDKAIPLFMKTQIVTIMLCDAPFPRPEAGIQRWKKIISEGLVDSFSKIH